MSNEQRAKPLNAKTRESLAVAIRTLFDEFEYLDDALKKGITNEKLRLHFVAKKDHLQRAGQWLESKLHSTE